MKDEENDKAQDEPEKDAGLPEESPPEDSEVSESDHPLLDLAETEEAPEPVKKEKSHAARLILVVVFLGGAGFLSYPYVQARFFPRPAPPPPKPVFSQPPVSVPMKAPVSQSKPLAPTAIETPTVIAHEEEVAVQKETGAPALEDRPFGSGLRISGAPTPIVKEPTDAVEQEMPVIGSGVPEHFALPEVQEPEREDAQAPSFESAPEAEETDEPDVERSKEVSAYLDFIELAMHKVRGWCLEAYDVLRGYLKSLLG